MKSTTTYPKILKLAQIFIFSSSAFVSNSKAVFAIDSFCAPNEVPPSSAPVLSSTDRYLLTNLWLATDGRRGFSSPPVSQAAKLTIDAFIQTCGNSANNERIVEKGGYMNGPNGTSLTGYGLEIANVATDSNGRMTYRLKFVIYDNSSGSIYGYVLYSNTVMGEKTWYQVDAMFDGSNMKIYINGVLDSQKAARLDPNQNIYQISVGAAARDRYINRFQGSLKNLQVYYNSITTTAMQQNRDYGYNQTRTLNYCP